MLCCILFMVEGLDKYRHETQAWWYYEVMVGDNDT